MPNVIERVAAEFNAQRALIYTTLPPTLSYDASVLEQTPIDITINNYDAGFTYTVVGNNMPAGSTLNRIGNTITFTSGAITGGDVPITIDVTAEDTVNGLAQSPAGVAIINVIDLTVINDTTDSVGVNDGVLLYQGTEISTTYITEVPTDTTRVDNQKIKTSKVAYNAIAYTGNGTSQDIVNGIEMNLNGRVVDKLGGQVWIKSRSNAQSNGLITTLSNFQDVLVTDSTAAAYSATVDFSWDGLAANSNGFTTVMGTNGSINTNAATYVSWNQATTKYTNGYTDDGKFYELEWNPLTGFVQGVYEGSGIAGHNIPTILNLDAVFIKNLDTAATSWRAKTSDMAATEYLILSGTNAVTADATIFNTVLSGNSFTVETNISVNESGKKHYFYGFANTTGKVKVGTYTGTGAGGNAITGLGFTPAYLMVKSTTAVGDWQIFDVKRNEISGSNDGALYANLNIAEIDNANRVTFDADGFTWGLNDAANNASGVTYMYIAIDDSAMETTLYTGNGTTQDIVTGLNMDWDGLEYPRIPGGMSWNKSRSSTYGHELYDSVRGATKRIVSNSTAAEDTQVNNLTKFNIDGVSIGSGVGINTNLSTYISWSWGTTHQYSGVTNQGKPYTCAWNPLTGFVIVKYTGSGTTGHEIPHHLDRALDLAYFKELRNINACEVFYGDMTKRMQLEDTSAELDALANRWVKNSSNYFSVSTSTSVNRADGEYILYGWANSMTQEVLEYTGTGTAGNFIKTKKKPAYVMIKRLDGLSQWAIFDNKRTNDGFELRANESIAEGGSDTVDFYQDGFLLKDTNAFRNTSGGRYLAFVMYETDEDTQGSKYYG